MIRELRAFALNILKNVNVLFISIIVISNGKIFFLTKSFLEIFETAINFIFLVDRMVHTDTASNW